MEITNVSIRDPLQRVGPATQPEVRSRCLSFEFWKRENGIIKGAKPAKF